MSNINAVSIIRNAQTVDDYNNIGGVKEKGFKQDLLVIEDRNGPKIILDITNGCEVNTNIGVCEDITSIEYIYKSKELISYKYYYDEIIEVNYYEEGEIINSRNDNVTKSKILEIISKDKSIMYLNLDKNVSLPKRVGYTLNKYENKLIIYKKLEKNKIPIKIISKWKIT